MIKVAYHRNPRVQPWVDGAVVLPGYECELEIGDAAELHLRHLNENAFDAFEFSLSNFFITRSRPDRAHLRWQAIPTFLLKADYFLTLHIRNDAGIRSFADLKGKRVAVPDFQMTAAVWMRIVLREMYGITPQDISWVNGRPPSLTHGQGATDTLNPSIQLRRLADGEVVNDLLQRGDVDAALGAPGCPVSSSAVVSPLPAQVGHDLWVEFRAKTGFLPVNHVLLIQEHWLSRDPELPLKLYDTLERSKQVAYQRAREAAAALLLFPEVAFSQNSSEFGEDPFPPGLRANRAMLETLVAELALEGLIPKPVDPASVFVPSLRGT